MRRYEPLMNVTRLKKTSYTKYLIILRPQNMITFRFYSILYQKLHHIPYCGYY